MSDAGARDAHGLRGFLNRGGFWRLVVLLVAYLVVYVGGGALIGLLGGHYTDDDLLSSTGSVFFQVTAGLFVGAVVLLALSAYLGWTGEMFGRQPIYRSWWMWAGPLIVATPIVLRLLGIDWGGPSPAVVTLVLASGLLVGFVEELAYRGYAVKMLRDGGHGERAVAVLSSLVFALSHSVNLLSGQSIRTVGPTVVYTFSFGVLMYLTLRTTGFLVGAMILHGMTDPTTILAVGGVDKLKVGTASNGFLTSAGLFTALLVLAGIVLVFFVRGRVPERPGVRAPGRA